MNKIFYVICISIILSVLPVKLLNAASVEVKEIHLGKPYNNDIIVDEDINNCNGNFPSKTVGVSLTTSEALEVSGGQSVTAGGSVVVYGVKLSLSSTIKNEVVRRYGSSISHSDNITLTAGTGKRIVHQIRHVRKFVKGYVIVQKTEYLIHKSTTSVPFTYCVSYKLKKEGQREINCPGPFLRIENISIGQHSGCRNNIKTYQTFVEVKNLGDGLVDNAQITADFTSLATRRTRRFPVVQGGYISAGRSFRYQGWAYLPCNEFPPRSQVHVMVVVTYKRPYTNYTITDKKVIQYQLPY